MSGWNSDNPAKHFDLFYIRLFYMTKIKYQLIKALMLCLGLEPTLGGRMEGVDEF